MIPAYVKNIFAGSRGRVPLRRFLAFDYRKVGYIEKARPTVWLWLWGMAWYYTALVGKHARCAARWLRVSWTALRLWRRMAYSEEEAISWAVAWRMAKEAHPRR